MQTNRALLAMASLGAGFASMAASAQKSITIADDLSMGVESFASQTHLPVLGVTPHGVASAAQARYKKDMADVSRAARRRYVGPFPTYGKKARLRAEAAGV